MQTDSKQLVEDVFCDIAERVAFMFGDPCAKDDLDFSGGPAYHVQISYAGPMKGRLEMVVSEETRRQIAANFTGMEADDEAIEPFCDDSVKEMLNVTCGNILTAMAGEEPVFDLTVPELTSYSQDEVSAFSDDDRSIAILLDDEPLMLRLTEEQE